MLERKAMRKFLEENFQDITVVGEAINGRKAIEMALDLKPDLMLMDIKMPGLNGIEAIEKICKQHPAIKFILVSAYDSFDYAKQAMKLGVKEYILKPSKKEETIRAILRVKKEVDEENKLREHTRHSKVIARELLISKLMQYELSEETIELQQSIFPSMQSGFFLVVKGVEKSKLNKLETYLSTATKDECIIDSEDNHVLLLFISQKKITKAEVLTLARMIHIELGNHVFIGAGYPYTNLLDLSKSYHEAIKAVKYLTDRKNSNYGFAASRQIRSKDLVDHLIMEIHAGNEKVAASLIVNFIEEKQDNDLMEVFYKIKQGLIDKGMVEPDMSYQNLLSNQDWIDYVKLACFNVQYHYQSQDKIERAKRYIHDNFDQPVSLEEIANLVELSTNYFSNLFRETTGETFIDYMTRIRLDKAKDYLRENNYSLKEISFMLGYKDPNYFSRVFKKYFAMSPKQYQQAILKK